MGVVPLEAPGNFCEHNGLAIWQHFRRERAGIAVVFEERFRLAAGTGDGPQPLTGKDDGARRSPTGALDPAGEGEIANVDGKPSAEGDFLQFGSSGECDRLAIGREEGIFRAIRAGDSDSPGFGERPAIQHPGWGALGAVVSPPNTMVAPS